TAVTPVGLLALLDALTLSVTSALLVYPVVRYSGNVAHTAGFLSLATAFVLLTAAAVDVLLFGPGLRVSLLVLLASLAALAGTASFARPFLTVPTPSPDDDPEPAAFEGRFDGGGEQ
ncbi:hypothetical protein ACFQEQ_15485, partial [Halolamina salina]|uniref:hypothetical protein n=1 Tax=Halolamina salina TaxID=1220023 RepID=UPI00360FF797